MRKGVLLVITEPGRASALEAALADIGYDVRRARTAEHALVLIGASMPDVVVTDLVQPMMSGLLLTELLKANPATNNIIVVATTNLLSSEVARVARDVGCADCVHEATGAKLLAARIATLHAGQYPGGRVEGYQVVLANDAQTALDAVERGSPDLVPETATKHDSTGGQSS